MKFLRRQLGGYRYWFRPEDGRGGFKAALRAKLFARWSASTIIIVATIASSLSPAIFIDWFGGGKAFAASQGPRQATASSDCTFNASTGVDWASPGNAFSSNDSWATASIGGTTDYLDCENFGFTIPTGSTIDGIVVDIERKCSNTGCTDADVFLTKDGSATVGTDKATATAYTTGDVTESHGTGTTDMWGTTWTPSEINASTFGVFFSAVKSGGPARTVSVDVISITVHYTANPTFQQSSFQWFENRDSSTINAWTLGGSGFDDVNDMVQTAAGDFIVAGTTTTFGGTLLVVSKFNSSFVEQWTRTIAGTGTSSVSAITETTDDSVVVVGTTAIGGTNSQIWALKFDNTTGAADWNIDLGSDTNDNGYAVAAADSGGVAITGDLDATEGGPYAKLPLIMLDASGTVTNSCYIGDGLSFGNAGYDLIQTSDSGFVVVGTIQGLDDTMVIKYDSLCAEEWTTSIDGGVTSWFSGHALAQASDGGFIIAGESQTGDDMLVSKITSSGGHSWTKTVDVDDTNAVPIVKAVTEASDGGFVVTGTVTNYGAGLNDVALVKFSSSGAEEWTTTFGGTGQDTPKAVAETSDGSFVVAATTYSFGAGNSDILMVKFDSSGQISGCGNHCESPSLSENAESPTITSESVTADGLFLESYNVGSSTTTSRSWTEDQIGTLADVADPLNGVAQDTATTAPAEGIPFRLRMTLHVTDATASSGSFKLQYSARGVDGLCDTSFTNESYADVTTTTPIAFYDNTGLTDGDDIVSSPDDPSHSGHTTVYQEYNEANNTSVSGNVIQVGQDGLWDFALTDNGAPNSTAYCFKMVTSAGADLGVAPSVVPMITTLDPDLNQASYRWFNGQDAVPNSTFLQTLGGASADYGYALAPTSDGGYIVTGQTQSYGTAGDLWLAKFDSSGTEEWTKTLGGASPDVGQSVIQSRDGGYVVTGYTSSYGAGNEDLWLVKFDSSGDEQWTKTLGGSGTDTGESVIQTSDGGYVVTGYMSVGGASFDLWLVKFSSSGVEQWTKTLGGTFADFGQSVIQTSDGGYAVAGYTANYGAGGSDLWLVKFSSSGAEEWTKTLGGASDEQGHFVMQTTDGDYIVGGYTWSLGAGDEDVLIAKFNSSGVEQWTKTFGGGFSDLGLDFAKTSDGGFAMTGYSNTLGSGVEDMWFAKFDSSGDEEWTKLVGGGVTDEGYGIAQTTDGGYAVAGYTQSYGAGSTDLWFAKLDYAGDINQCSALICTTTSLDTVSQTVTEANQSLTETNQTLTESDQTSQTTLADQTSSTTTNIQGGHSSFVVRVGSSGSDTGNGLVQTDDGSYVIAGTVNNGTTSNDTTPIKFSPTGVEQWSSSRGVPASATSETGLGIVKSSDGGYVLTGRTQSVGSGDIWLTKFDDTGSQLWTTTTGTASNETGEDIIATSDGGYMVSGQISATDILLSKFDSSGGTVWNKTLGDTGTDRPNSVIQTSDGGYAIVGSTTSFSVVDIMISKFDGNGDEQWTKTLGDTGNDTGESIIQTSDGGYAITGSTAGFGTVGTDLIISKFNSSGIEEWTKTAGGSGSDTGNSIVAVSDGGYVVAGTTASVGAGSNDVWIIKFDSSGDIQWSKTIGGTGADTSTQVIETSDGGYAVSAITASFGASSNDVLLVKVGVDGEIPGCASGCTSQSINEADQTATEVDRSLTSSADLGLLSLDASNAEVPLSFAESYAASLALWTDTGPIPAAPIGSQDSAGVSTRHDEPLRLRFGLLATKGVSLGSADLKLQVAARVGGVCETDFGGGESYEDISGSVAFNYYDTPNLATGDWALTGGSDPTVDRGNMWHEDYQESAPFTNRHHIGGPGMPNYGLWDISLTPTDNALYGNYCLRVVNSNDTLLNEYDRIFEVSLPPAPSQQMRHGRFFDTNTGTAQPIYW